VAGSRAASLRAGMITAISRSMAAMVPRRVSAPPQRRPEDAERLASGKLLLDEPAPGVARLTISNPEKRGALDHELLDALAEACGRLDARCLLITGEGQMFSAGYDIGTFEDPERFADEAERLVAHPFHAAIEALERYPYPVVAALNGHAIGGGLELAITADVRVAASGIKLGMPPAKLGLVYSHTGLRKFVETCGLPATNELFYLARNIDTERALAIGLVNHLVEPDELVEAGVSLATEIAANAPLSLSGNKRILRALREHPGRLPEELERELVELRESCFRTEDFREGVAAFGERRAPQWSGR
jgi:enoyl-CoA hydratase/carnithine racemase